MGLDAGFLSMLEGRVSWEKMLGEDAFGNESYDLPVIIEAYIGDFIESFGYQDGNHMREGVQVWTTTLFTNYKGIQARDRFLVGTRTMYATSVSTGQDEQGNPLYHEVEVSTVKKG